MAATNFRTKLRALAGAVVDEYFVAAANFSGCSFKFVSPGSVQGEVIGATGASNPMPLGVIQNEPAALGLARVRTFGVTTLTGCPTACNLLWGSFITSNSAGTACIAGAAGITLGRWLSASVVSSGSTTTGCAFVNCAAFGSACVGAAS